MFDILNDLAALQGRQREMADALGKQGIRTTHLTINSAFSREGRTIFISRMYLYGLMEDGQVVMLYKHDGDLPWHPQDFADLIDDAFVRLAEMERVATVLLLREAARR